MTNIFYHDRIKNRKKKFYFKSFKEKIYDIILILTQNQTFECHSEEFLNQAEKKVEFIFFTWYHIANTLFMINILILSSRKNSR